MTPEQYTKGIDDVKSLAREGDRKEIERVMLKMWDSIYADGVRLRDIANECGMKEDT